MTDILEEFLELVKIPSPSGQEDKMAEALLGKLSEIGLTVKKDEAGNVYGFLQATDPGKTEAVCLMAHMDRVPGGDSIHPISDGTVIRTDGTSILAADDLSGVCAVLNGLRRIQEGKKPHGPVEVLFTVYEENGLLGAKRADYSLITAKNAYCFDSSGRIGRIVTGAPTIRHLKLKVYGKKSHAGAEPEKGINALKTAAKIIAEVKEGRLDEETTSNFGIFHAGSATNIICDYAEVTAEARSHQNGKIVDYEAYVLELIRKICENEGVRYETEIWEDCRAFRVEHSEPVVTVMAEAMEELGIAAKPEVGGGGMDANVLNLHGIHTVGVATGYLKNHTFDEELYIEDLIQSGKLVEKLIEKWGRSC